jgi:hypothetical protein
LFGAPINVSSETSSARPCRSAGRTRQRPAMMPKRNWSAVGRPAATQSAVLASGLRAVRRRWGTPSALHGQLRMSRSDARYLAQNDAAFEVAAPESRLRGQGKQPSDWRAVGRSPAPMFRRHEPPAVETLQRR